MHIACWKTKVTQTHSEYVIFLPFFTAKMVKQTRLGVRVQAQCLFCTSVRMVIFIANTFKVTEFVYFTDVYFLQFPFSIQIRLRCCFARVVIITLSKLCRL
jgi:hypothetical protein